jgi:hypothetical protein
LPHFDVACGERLGAARRVELLFDAAVTPARFLPAPLDAFQREAGGGSSSVAGVSDAAVPPQA